MLGRDNNSMSGAVQVREAVLTSALLRLPSTMSRAQKESRVDQILAELVRHISLHACCISCEDLVPPGACCPAV